MASERAETPLLTIIVPWLNDPRLTRILTAVHLSPFRHDIQTVIAIDGGDEREVLRLASRMGMDVTTAVGEVNRGPGVARNLGLAVASGTYVAFVDADDIPQVDILYSMSEYAANAHLDVCIADYAVSDLPRSPVKARGAFRVAQGKHWNALSLALITQPAVWRCVFRREHLVSRSLSFPALRYAEDLIFMYRVVRTGPTSHKLPTLCYVYTSPNRRPFRRRDWTVARNYMWRQVLASESRELRTLALIWLLRLEVRRIGHSFRRVSRRGNAEDPS